MHELRRLLLWDAERDVYPVEIAGQTFYVKRMTALERLSLFDANRQIEMEHPGLPGSHPRHQAMLVVRSACDETGQLIFNESDEQELAENGVGVVLEKLWMTSLKVNGLNGEEVEKNSEGTDS